MQVFLKDVFRRHVFLVTVVIGLAVALTATLLPRALSHAATGADGIEWVPGAAQYVADQSGCHTEQAATFHAPSNELAKKVAAGIEQEKEDGISKYGIDTMTATNINVSGSDVNFSIDGYYDCPSSGDSRVNNRVNLQADGLGTWPKIVLASLATTAVFFSVTIIAEITLASLIPVLAPVAVKVAATALEGCIGGSAAAAVAQAIHGFPDWKTTLVAEVAGCIAGAVTVMLLANAATLLTQALERELGRGANAVGGRALADAAGGVELTPVTEVITATTDALEAAR